MINRLIYIVLLVSLPFSVFAADYEAGVHYRVLEKPIASPSDTIVVNEFFGYTCPHCNAFHPLLEHWTQQQGNNVSFVPVPVVFSRSWEPYAKAYYIANILGVIEQTHDAMFSAIHVNKRRITTRAALSNFFSEHGVDAKAFDEAYESFALKNMLRQSKRLAAKAKITGVPSMMVDGKYVISAPMAGSHESMLKVVDYLIDKERK